MGKASRDKGGRFERAIVNALRAAGQVAHRVPLSGGAGGDFSDDIVWQVGTQTLRLEAKARGNGFKFLYDNLKPGVPLVIKADRREPLLVLTLSQAIELIGVKQASDAPTTTPAKPRESKAKASAISPRDIGLQAIEEALAERLIH